MHSQSVHSDLFFFSFKFLKSVYFQERGGDSDSKSRGGTERRGDTESEPGSRLGAVSTEPDAGLQLTNPDNVT